MSYAYFPPWRYHRQPNGGWTRTPRLGDGEACVDDSDTSPTNPKHSTDARCPQCTSHHSHSVAIHRASIEAANDELKQGTHE